MNVKDVIEVEIGSSGMDGEGVARVDGKVVFIPYTLEGERVRAVVKTVKKNFCTAQAIKILQASRHRVEPSCPHYYKCGGCDTMHFSAEYRKNMLVDDFRNNLKKIADLSADDIPFVECERSARNKTAMPFGLRGGNVVLGMYSKNTHDIVPVECFAAGGLARNIGKIVCDLANEKKLSVYDGASGRGLLRHLVVRVIGERAQAVLIVNCARFADESVLKALCARIPRGVDFFICFNTAKNNVIMSDRITKIKGDDRLEVNVMGVVAELSPLSFFQVNDEIRDKLYERAIGHVLSENLIDLYRGIGITSNLAARKCKRVTAVECVSQAVRDADRTAELNGNSHKIVNLCGNVEDVIDGLDGGDCDVLIDPPRKGCGVAVMAAVAKKAPNRIIYISCNHATMCRDIKPLTDTGEYKVVDCAVFDMFCNTHHTETMLCLERM